jgi:hypothetical protein
LEEFKESMARKSNIIIFRAEESKKTEPKERKVEDIAIVNELCKITGTNKQTVKNVTRLGKKDVDSDNPRPICLRGVLLPGICILPTGYLPPIPHFYS